MEGIIKAVCISEKRGTVKKNINEVKVIKDFGLEGDAHAGKWHRQVSFLSADIVDEFNEKGASVIEGDFGENVLVYGIDFKKLPVGTKLICNDRASAKCWTIGWQGALKVPCLFIYLL